MQVVITIALFAAIGAWWLTVYRRLVRLRAAVKLAWTKLDVDRSNDAVRQVYNRHVATYNRAREDFPANIVSALAGLSAARPYEHTTST